MLFRSTSLRLCFCPKIIVLTFHLARADQLKHQHFPRFFIIFIRHLKRSENIVKHFNHSHLILPYYPNVVKLLLNDIFDQFGYIVDKRSFCLESVSKMENAFVNLFVLLSSILFRSISIFGQKVYAFFIFGHKLLT